MNQREILENIYKESFYEYSKGNLNSSLGDDIKNMIMLLAQNAENAKAINTVLITLLTQKIFNPKQDIRFHQAQLAGGFSGRVIDTNYITPFMKEVKFPAMSE